MQVSAILALAQVARFSGDINAAEDWLSAAAVAERYEALLERIVARRQARRRA